jgi:hypothetical protein
METVSTIAVAPPLSMPEPLQTIFFWVSLVATLGMLVYSLTVAKRLGTAIPVLLVFGAFCSIPLESIAGFLGHVEHPAGGNIALYSAVDRTIPWHVAFGYTVGFAAVYLVIFQKAVAGRLYRSTIYKTTITTALCYFVGETIGVSTHLWVYFDPQPLWIWRGTEPPIWGILNATSEILGVSLVVFLRPYLTGAKQLLVVLLCPVGTLMGHFGAGFPWYNVINSGASPLMMDLSVLASVGLAVMIWWIASILVTTPAAEPAR